MFWHTVVPQRLAQCMTHSRHPGNVCGMNARRLRKGAQPLPSFQKTSTKQPAAESSGTSWEGAETHRVPDARRRCAGAPRLEAHLCAKGCLASPVFLVCGLFI